MDIDGMEIRLRRLEDQMKRLEPMLTEFELFESRRTAARPDGISPELHAEIHAPLHDSPEEEARKAQEAADAAAERAKSIRRSNAEGESDMTEEQRVIAADAAEKNRLEVERVQRESDEKAAAEETERKRIVDQEQTG